MHAAGKILVKTFLKAIRDFFFSQYVELPNLCYFYTTEGESSNPPRFTSSLIYWDILIFP